MLVALMVPLALTTLFFAATAIRAAIARHAVPTVETLALGAVTNFFDTLGIGSFAPTLAWFKFRNLVPDRLIPCTMLVGYTLPSMVQAMIFLILLGVLVDPVLLVGCVFALLMGAVLGAGLVAKARSSAVQGVVAVALLVAAILYAMTNLDLMPGGGTAASLPPKLTVIAIAANFGFGLLLNFGVGNYAPSLVMFSLMGMDPHLSFPIMAGGAAFAGAAASTRHIAMGKVDLRIAAGLAIGGIPAVLVAAFLVRSMPLAMLRWLVIVVVVYAAGVMLRAAYSSRREERALTVEQAVAI
ncbi:MAG: anion permease [Alphaproteobacteria bacterium]|nr:anion permease [Alphaproteobacteria bacterium]